MMKYTGTDPDIPIVFEDNHLLVIDKPHNMLSQEDRTGDPDVLSLCKRYLKNEYNKTGNVYLGLVHRLDRPAGGLMVLAKTSKAAERLARQMRDRLIRKTYWAVVHGKTPENGVLTHHLLKNRQTNIVETVSSGNRNAKQAVLSFKRLENRDGLTLLEVHLQTGRPHQIRVQLAADGYPVWGDYKYGKKEIPDGLTLGLRAFKLGFEHPVKKEEIDFILPPPNGDPWKRFDIKNKLNGKIGE